MALREIAGAYATIGMEPEDGKPGAAGRDGVGSYSVDLDNENINIGLVSAAGGYAVADVSNSGTCGVYVAAGQTANALIARVALMESDGTTVAAEVSTPGSQALFAGTGYNGVVTMDALTVHFAAGSTAFAPGQRLEFPLVITLAITDGGGSRQETVRKKVKFSFQPPANDGKTPVIYELVPSTRSIVRHENGTWSPAAVTCQIRRTVGEVQTMLTDGQDGCAIKYWTTALSYADYPATGVPVDNTCSTLRFALERGGVIIDEETIAAVADGPQGGKGNDGTNAASIDAIELSFDTTDDGHACPQTQTATPKGWFGTEECDVKDIELESAAPTTFNAATANSATQITIGFTSDAHYTIYPADSETGDAGYRISKATSGTVRFKGNVYHKNTNTKLNGTQKIGFNVSFRVNPSVFWNKQESSRRRFARELGEVQGNMVTKSTFEQTAKSFSMKISEQNPERNLIRDSWMNLVDYTDNANASRSVSLTSGHVYVLSARAAVSPEVLTSGAMLEVYISRTNGTNRRSLMVNSATLTELRLLYTADATATHTIGAGLTTQLNDPTYHYCVEWMQLEDVTDRYTEGDTAAVLGTEWSPSPQDTAGNDLMGGATMTGDAMSAVDIKSGKTFAFTIQRLTPRETYTLSYFVKATTNAASYTTAINTAYAVAGMGEVFIEGDYRSFFCYGEMGGVPEWSTQATREWRRVTFSFSPAFASTAITLVQGVTFGAVSVAGIKLEKGGLDTFGEDSINRLWQTIQDTGIDIMLRKILATADNFIVRNNSGQRTMTVDAQGRVVANPEGGNASAGMGDASFPIWAGQAAPVVDDVLAPYRVDTRGVVTANFLREDIDTHASRDNVYYHIGGAPQNDWNVNFAEGKGHNLFR